MSCVRPRPAFPPAFRRPLRLDVLGLMSVCFSRDEGSELKSGGVGCLLPVVAGAFDGLPEFWSPRV